MCLGQTLHQDTQLSQYGSVLYTCSFMGARHCPMTSSLLGERCQEKVEFQGVRMGGAARTPVMPLVPVTEALHKGWRGHLQGQGQWLSSISLANVECG